MSLIDSLPGKDGELLAQVITLARQAQREAHGRPFKLAQRHVQNCLELPDLAAAGQLLRQLEKRGYLECVQRGTKDTPEVKGVAALWRLHELEERLQ
jgi:hypothetical protein